MKNNRSVTCHVWSDASAAFFFFPWCQGSKVERHLLSLFSFCLNKSALFVCVVCAQVGIQGEQVTPLFVLWLTIKHGWFAHRSQSVRTPS